VSGTNDEIFWVNLAPIYFSSCLPIKAQSN
jgi:hypothetical protein